LVPSPPPGLSSGSVGNRAEIDFEPTDDSVLKAIEASLSVPNGNAFLSWLAEQLENKASDEFDPYVEYGENCLFAWEEEEELSYDINSAYAEVDDEPSATVSTGVVSRFRVEPRVEVSPDGWRLEIFPGGSKVVKDVLGRVTEVHSQFGDCLYVRYGTEGYIESFERIRADGSNHTEGKRDKHGVVVRDAEGRVRAAGESMSVDPRGCFYLHTFDGQFFSVDLVTGIHTERRKVTDERGYPRFVTSMFAHDGFRMATMFGGAWLSTAYGADLPSRFRFYGRDGTMIEFQNDYELQQRRPSRVLRPASRRLCRSWPHRRQARTAWDAVHEYLSRGS
jgi:hypothetical protein